MVPGPVCDATRFWVGIVSLAKTGHCTNTRWWGERVSALIMPRADLPTVCLTWVQSVLAIDSSWACSRAWTVVC